MSIRSAVTVSLVPEARGGPFVYRDDLPEACRKARALGYDAVEIFPPTADALDPGRLRTILSDHGLALAAMGTGAGWLRSRLHLCLPEPSARARAADFIRSIIDLAGPLGAPAILGSMQGRSSDSVDAGSAAGYLADALEALGEYAGRHGVPLVFEPLNRYETDLVNTLGEGLKVVGSLSTKNIVLLADLFHMNIEEADMAAAILAAGPHIGHVHFVDSNRRPAGLGHIDFAPIAAALGQIGYHGFASAEALPYPDPDAAALATMTAFRRFFPAAG